MKGRIFTYATYKAWSQGLLTSGVNPRHTSRECHRCHAPVIRYHAGQAVEGWLYARRAPGACDHGDRPLPADHARRRVDDTGCIVARSGQARTGCAVQGQLLAGLVVMLMRVEHQSHLLNKERTCHHV